MKKWYQKPIAIATAAACLLAGGAIGFSLDSLPQLQLTAEAEDKIYTGESDELQLEYEELDDGTVTITKFVSSSSTDIELPSVIDGKAVTSIGANAFNAYNIETCSNLTNVIIPDSVTSIGDFAFYNCTSLTDVTIPDSVTSIGDYAFEGCESLTSIIIPDSVTSIGSCAFYDCTSLTDVTIPDSVTSIGDYTFGWCTSLTEIIVDSNNESYTSKDGVLFDKSLETIICYPEGKMGNFTIPDSVTSIGDGAFGDCTSLTDITIPASVTSIGDWAFSGCANLTSVTIPDSVTSIGSYAFHYCENLTDITIPANVTSIGDYAFFCCANLTSITIPDSVTSIDYEAFYNCTSLTDVTISKSVTSIGSSAFANCTNLTDIYYKGTESEWNEISIGDSVIPSNVTIHYESEPVTTTTTTTTTTKPITTTTSTTTTISEDTVAYGDVNTDNVVDLRDTIVLNKYLANIIQFSDVQMANADCYKDGNLDEKDASTLMQFVISLIQDIPVIEE